MSGSSPGGGDEDSARRNFANVVALVAVVVLVILGYWAFTALDHARKFQRCLDSGRRNCVDYVDPNN